ncbi:hypothetical protein [Prevotellamassilia timonensis]|uniref:hypothetical protein n=1 Tax=Prevotellamassilia timonensis TaxID=1852370 RepID=UPI00307E3BF7
MKKKVQPKGFYAKNAFLRVFVTPLYKMVRNVWLILMLSLLLPRIGAFKKDSWWQSVKMK